MPAPARVAGIIKRCLGEVGIPVDVILSEPADHQRALWAGEHDLALHGWFNDNGDPDNFLYTLLDSDNTTGTPPVEHRVLQQRLVPRRHRHGRRRIRDRSRTERERLYSQAQAILAIDVPWVPLAHSKVVFAQRARAARAGGAAVGDGPLSLGGARAMSPPDGKGPKAKRRREAADPRGEAPSAGGSKRLVELAPRWVVERQHAPSSIFRAAEWLGRGASVWSLPVSAVMRRRGLRRRLSAVLIIAALGPVIAVSASRSR